MRKALEETFAAVANLAVAGRTDTGVHALGQVVTVDVEGGPPPERAAGALNSRLPAEITVDRVRRGRPGLPRAPLGAVPQLPLPPLHARHALAVRNAPQPVACRAPSTTTRSTRRRPPSPADTTSAPSRRPRHSTRSSSEPSSGREWIRSRRPPRLRDHRRQLPPPHGAKPRRDDARGAGLGSGAAGRALRARKRVRRRRHGGSTSCRLPTIRPR